MKKYLDFLFELIAPGKSGGGSGPSITVEPLAVTANGEYEAEEGTAYSPVDVNVRPNVIARAITENGTYRASEQGRDGYSQVDVSVRGDFLPAMSEGYTEYKNVVQSAYIKSMIGTATGSTVTIRVPTTVTVAINDKVLFDGDDTTNHLIYGAWGVVTATRAYSGYRSVTLRVDGVSVRPTGAVTMSKMGYGTHPVVGDLSVQVNSNLEDIQSYPISMNGQYVIAAQAGYDGIGSVTVDVSVAGGGGGEEGEVRQLEELYAYSDNTYTPSEGVAYSVVHVATGAVMPVYGEYAMVPAEMPCKGSVSPAEGIAFGPVDIKVERGPATVAGHVVVVDLTVYGDGTYVAGPGYAFGNVYVVTSGGQSVTPQSYQLIDTDFTENGSFMPASGNAYGNITVSAIPSPKAEGMTLEDYLLGNGGELVSEDITEFPAYGLASAKNIKVSLPNCTVVHDGAFAYSDSLELDLPIAYDISAKAFASAKNLGALKLPAWYSFDRTASTSVLSSKVGLYYVYVPAWTQVPNRAFESSTDLERIEFGPNVTAVGSYAFGSCTKLKEVIFGDGASPVVPTAAASSFYNMDASVQFYVPDALVATYQSATGWSDYASQIHPLSDLVGYIPGEYTPA